MQRLPPCCQYFKIAKISEFLILRNLTTNQEKGKERAMRGRAMEKDIRIEAFIRALSADQCAWPNLAFDLQKDKTLIMANNVCL